MSVATQDPADRGGGPLEEQLLEAALVVLQRRGPGQLSLRSVAQELGVSHQAPYVHFGDKRTFLAAVAGLGLQRAAERATACVAAAGDDPSRRLHALAGAYVAFVREQPHVHDLAYGPMVAKADHPRLQSAAIDYWNLLHASVAACQPAGVPEEQVLRRCIAAWGTVQGIARLAAHRQIPASVPGDTDRLVHEALDALRTGWWSTIHD
jgi:AcrR family transcriptional regulator